ncbi:hypothetical protein XELAEV_18032364mg [Xenopus laevis]|uniref:Uncharacterized protein n=1 Tax=Xenopus laevis TaxID=8355 RepID=A0A974CPE9_XENLA|nr:hypothetical protein XELAEV_18032364mg [Xenopus laevis]
MDKWVGDPLYNTVQPRAFQTRYIIQGIATEKIDDWEKPDLRQVQIYDHTCCSYLCLMERPQKARAEVLKSLLKTM